ncbi:MAG: hypothetical protein U0353_35145 [Sandaracinus sp.]
MSSSPIQRAITEAIESVASTEARVSILVRALGRAGIARVPERGPEVMRFLEGPLLDALVERLGASTATEIADHLRPVLRMAARASSVAPPTGRATQRPPTAVPETVPPGAEEPATEPRPTLRVADPGRFDPDAHDRPTSVPPEQTGVRRTPAPMPAVGGDVSHTAPTRRMETPKDDHLPAASVFVLATLDDALAAALESLREVEVRRVRGLFELVDASDDSRERATTLIFDCGAPPVHVASLLALAADMPDVMHVAVLGAAKLDMQALSAAPDRTIGWYYLDRTSPEDLARKVSQAARSARATGS